MGRPRTLLTSTCLLLAVLAGGWLAADSLAGSDTRPGPARPAPEHPRSSTLPPGSALPSARSCARRIGGGHWEPRPENQKANHRTPRTAVFARIDGGDRAAQRVLLPRVRGDYRGTTPFLIRVAACKWGFRAKVVRARVWVESSWRQSHVGDAGQSFGLLQVKRSVHGGYPWTSRSTALNLDYALAWTRACYEGWMSHWLPAAARGDHWGCLGLWYSGRWQERQARYLGEVRRAVKRKPWSRLG